LYQRAGCRGVGKRYNFHINRSDLDKFPSAPGDVEIISYQQAEHLKQFAEIQQREAIRFLRPVDDFKAMLDVIVMRRGLGQRNDILAVRIDGTCFAYMVISIDQKRDSEELVCRIGEYAGSRLAIMSAIKMLFEKHDFNELNVGVLPQDTEFFYILEALDRQPSVNRKAKPSVKEVNTLAGTMRIINFERLMEHFIPYLQQRLGRKTVESLQFKCAKPSVRSHPEHRGRESGTNDGKHIFQIADEQFIIENEADLVQLILGTPDNKELEIMPNEGKLAEVLREVLPLPFVWPGLNFV